MIKLISLDMWNTLIKSNPEYAKKRNEYLAYELSLPDDEVEKIYRTVKIESDKMAESESKCLSNTDIYKKFLSLIERQRYDWMKIRTNLERLFCKYPPIVLPETIESIHNIQENNIELSIASNTNFIRGEVLNKAILSKWRINWKFYVFSDQINYPKPHFKFWKNVIRKASNISPKEILHIGDNKICDGSCSTFDIQFQHVDYPSNLKYILRGIS